MAMLSIMCLYIKPHYHLHHGSIPRSRFFGCKKYVVHDDMAWVCVVRMLFYNYITNHSGQSTAQPFTISNPIRIVRPCHSSIRPCRRPSCMLVNRDSGKESRPHKTEETVHISRYIHPPSPGCPSPPSISCRQTYNPIGKYNPHRDRYEHQDQLPRPFSESLSKDLSNGNSPDNSQSRSSP
jgi:hypothetical protein